MITNNVIVASKTAPNPITTKYWADLTENPYGGIIKYYDGKKWDYVNNKDEQDTDLKNVESFINNLKNDTVTVVRPSDITTTTTTVGIDTIERNYRVQSNGNIQADADDSMGSTITLPAATASKAGVMTSADKTKLDGIAVNANNYTLPTASLTTLGGIKTGYNTSATSKQYAVLIDDNGNAYVNLNSLINNTLTSADVNIALSAAQGKALKDLYDTLEARVAALEAPETTA